VTTVTFDKSIYQVGDTATASIKDLKQGWIKYMVVNQVNGVVYEVLWYNFMMSEDAHKFTISDRMIGKNWFYVQWIFITYVVDLAIVEFDVKSREEGEGREEGVNVVLVGVIVVAVGSIVYLLTRKKKKV
jgi:hypothetical protein